MSDVFYLRPVDPPATPEAVLASADEASGCFGLHRVEWTTSFLSADGGRLLCWYRAPDAESARLALRELGSDLAAVWPGKVLGGVAPRDPAVPQVDVLAELAFPSAPEADGEALLDALRRAAGRLGHVAYAFLSNRRDRLVCLVRGGDADGLPAAFAAAGFPGAVAWRCQVVTPRP
ncbi:MAG TPA: hypothetical protein VKZ85_04195 [Woeseiaceae bacterium]|nr:hypothetical protein [Woeseiaceae bacterium]